MSAYGKKEKPETLPLMNAVSEPVEHGDLVMELKDRHDLDAIVPPTGNAA